MTGKITPTDALKHYAHSLQMQAPREWDAFVECFDAFSIAVTVAVTKADQSEILNKQGQAQAFLHLLDTFRTCHLKPTTIPNQPSP